jgi:hypothetical protein
MQTRREQSGALGMWLIHAPGVVAERGAAVDRWAVVTRGRESAERDDTRLPCTKRGRELVRRDVIALTSEQQ